MNNSFFRSFQSEWLKKQHTAAAWLVIIGGFFVPFIILLARLIRHQRLVREVADPDLWQSIISNCWQFMAVFLLPMGVILVTSLISQIEFRNNTWKQLHTTPQSYTTVFFAKFSVILVMLLQFFLFFNIGIFIAGMLPSLVVPGVSFPKADYPFLSAMRISASFFLDCLPIVALQYLLGLQFKNFLVPFGIGIGLYVASMIAVAWSKGYLVPYTYCAINFVGNKSGTDPDVNIHVMAAGYFVVITVLSFFLYQQKRVKG